MLDAIQHLQGLSDKYRRANSANIGKRKRLPKGKGKSLQKTTLDEYLHDYHVIFSNAKCLQIVDQSISATGYATKIDGRYCTILCGFVIGAILPIFCITILIRSVRPSTTNDYFPNRLLLWIKQMMPACPDPVANEKDIDIFGKVAIERPVRRILQEVT